MVLWRRERNKYSPRQGQQLQGIPRCIPSEASVLSKYFKQRFQASISSEAKCIPSEASQWVSSK
jgi:hypothetical protein